MVVQPEQNVLTVFDAFQYLDAIRITCIPNGGTLSILEHDALVLELFSGNGANASVFQIQFRYVAIATNVLVHEFLPCGRLVLDGREFTRWECNSAVRQLD